MSEGMDFAMVEDCHAVPKNEIDIALNVAV